DVTLPISSLTFSASAPAPSELYPLSLHDALPIWSSRSVRTGERTDRPLRVSDQHPEQEHEHGERVVHLGHPLLPCLRGGTAPGRSEEHTSELQSRFDLVCRLLLEKKKSHMEAGHS